jgi:transcriptional regulator EpsA
VTPTNKAIEATGQAESMIRMIEASMAVQRRSQFFVWAQSYVGTLLPHDVAVCGAYERAQRQLAFEPFRSVAVPAPLLAALSDGHSMLMQQLACAWVEGGGRATLLDLAALGGQASTAGHELLLAAGFGHLLMHGVARPGRPAELESLFVLSARGQRWTEEHRACLELMLPYLHSTYLRVLHTEREMRVPPAAAHGLSFGEAYSPITKRERQILAWVREGKSNLEIGAVLGISPLTVKNHVQKILRKLGAANRAQAVAMAMSLDLLGRGSPHGEAEPAPAGAGAARP